MEKRGHTLGVLFPLGLLAVYAVAAAAAVLLAADSYRNSLDRAEGSFACSTAAAYVTEKLRAGDREDAVRITELGDCPALVVSVNREESWYDTYIYCYDGSLRELMVKRELTPEPDMGTALLELERFRPEWAGDGVMKLTCERGGETVTRYVNLKAGEGYSCG